MKSLINLLFYFLSERLQNYCIEHHLLYYYAWYSIEYRYIILLLHVCVVIDLIHTQWLKQESNVPQCTMITTSVKKNKGKKIEKNK